MLSSEILLTEVREPKWQHGHVSKPGTTEEPCFWAAAVYNAFSVGFTTTLVVDSITVTDS